MILFVKEITGYIKYLEALKIENSRYMGHAPENATQVLNDFISELRGLVNLQLIDPSVQLPVSTFTGLGTTLRAFATINLSIPGFGRA
jgi:hypothetical protein